MLTLCKYVDKHTVEALKDPVPEKIQTLVEINRNIASGLLQSLEEGGGETQAAQPAEGDTPQEHSAILASVNAQVCPGPLRRARPFFPVGAAPAYPGLPRLVTVVTAWPVHLH